MKGIHGAHRCHHTCMTANGNAMLLCIAHSLSSKKWRLHMGSLIQLCVLVC